MVLAQFLSWLDCHEKTKYSGNGVFNPNAKLSFVVGLKFMFYRALEKETLEEALEVCNTVFDAFPVQAFEIPEEAEEAKGIYQVQSERLIRYFFSTGRKLLNVSKGYPDLTIPGLPVDDGQVHGTIDLVTKTADGSIELVLLDMFHKNVYKRKARKPCNKPEAAPELFIPALSLNLFGESIYYSVWYFNGGEDKKGVYPEFETKEGANIATTNFSGDRKVAENSLASLLTIREESRKCSTCSCAAVCMGYKETIKAPGDVAEVKLSASKKSKTLTVEQEEVANFRNGSACVIAIPGSGKTHTLIERTVRMVREGIPLSSQLFVTFTNKACSEIKERLRKELGESVLEEANIKTFNGLGYDILRANDSLLGRKVLLATESTKREMMRAALLKNPRLDGFSYSTLDGENGLVARFDGWATFFEKVECNEELFAEQYPTVDFERFKLIYDSYKDVFDAEGFINYDDQVRLVNKLFSDFPVLKTMYSKLFKYITVDEFQDVNAEQVQLLQSISSHGNILCVGDDDQGIYSWRGGSNEFMLEFPLYFKDSRIFHLTKNFRSNAKIIAAANECIKHNGKRAVKNLVASFDADCEPVIADSFSDDDTITQFLTPMIKAYGAKNIAVVARANKRLVEFRKKLVDMGIESTNPKDYLIQDKSFQTIYDLLGVYLLGYTERSASFARLYNSAVGPEIVDVEYGESYYDGLVKREIIKPLERTSVCKAAYSELDGPVGEFGRKIFRSFEEFDYATDIEECFTNIINIWYPEADSNMYVAVNALAEIADESGFTSLKEVYKYMEAMNRYSDQTRISYVYGDAVNLLTAHDSKGKEFDAVIILDGDLFINEPNDEEARRVLYVAITRAKHTLVFTTSGTATNDRLFYEVGNTCKVCSM